MKKFLRRGIRLLCGLAILLIGATILYPVFVSSSGSKRSICRSNLRNIGLAQQQYIQDYNGIFPTVALKNSSTFGWADALSPYIKSHDVFYCDESNTIHQDDPHQRNYTDYWMNGTLSGVSLDIIDSTSLTLLNGDGNDGVDGSNARYNLKSIPPKWTSDAQSPLYRHLEGCNYAFTDGHVKWVRASKSEGLRFGLE